jgi:hypothetical protein
VPLFAGILNFNPKSDPTYCFVRLSDIVFACGPISTLRDVMLRYL